MKMFHNSDKYFSLTVLELKAVPIATAFGKDNGVTIAKILCEDAYYLASNGEEQISIELLRISGKKHGNKIIHLLIVRCYDNTESGCSIRHEACIMGLTDLLQRKGYIVEEMEFRQYSEIFHSKINSDTAWALKKEEIVEQGISGSNYKSIPVVNQLDWEGVYAALDGSNCSLSIQIIPSKLTAKEKQAIMTHYAEASQAVDGGMGSNLRDSLVGTSKERWKYYADSIKKPMARVNIVVSGPTNKAALVVARIQRAFADVPLRLLKVDNWKQLSLFNLPWKIGQSINAMHQVAINKWTSQEVSQILAFPQQTASFIGIKVNPFSRVIETDLLPEPLAENDKDKIYIGNTASGQPVFLPLELFNLHTGIFGKSGTGKTTFLKYLIRALKERNISVLVLEPIKREYRELAAEKGTRVFTVESAVTPLLVNPFRVPKGVRLGEYRSSLLTAFKAAFSMPDPLPSLFEKAIGEAYAHYGWTDSSKSDDPNVTIFDMSDFIDVFQRIIVNSQYSGEVKGNMLSGGSFRLQSLIERCPKTFDTFHSTDVIELLSGNVVLEMGQLEPEQKALVTALTLISVMAYLKVTRNSDEQLRNIILLDEAHALLDNGDAATEEEKVLNNAMNQLLINLVAEVRALGVGIIFSDQSPSRIGSNLMDNVENIISFRLNGQEAKRLMENVGAENLTEETLAMFSRGQMILSNHYLRRPIGITVHYQAKREPKVLDDYSLAKSQSQYLMRHAKDYCPYRQCKLGGCQMCMFSVREDAKKRSIQMYQARGSKLNTIEGFASHIERVPAALAAQGCEVSADDFAKLCVCTAVHVIRKVKMEMGISLTENALIKLIDEVKKNILILKEG